MQRTADEEQSRAPAEQDGRRPGLRRRSRASSLVAGATSWGAEQGVGALGRPGRRDGAGSGDGGAEGRRQGGGGQAAAGVGRAEGQNVRVGDGDVFSFFL